MVSSSNFKPFYNIPVKRFIDIFKVVNFSWFLIRLPMVALVIPSAYAVAQFAGEYLPSPWNWISGVAFELTYIGAIALADQQQNSHKTKLGKFEFNPSTVLWLIVNIVAVLASTLSNLLFFNGGTYAATTAETLTHAVPLPLLAFVYGLLVHNYTYSLTRKVVELEQALPFQCPACEKRFKTVKALNGHKAQCTAAKPQQRVSKG